MAARRVLALMVACFLYQHIASGMQCLSGFVTKDILIEKAASLGENRIRGTRRGGQQRLVPGIKFTCSVKLSSWLFVADNSGGGSEYPALQVWRPQNEDETQYTKIHEITGLPLGTDDTNVYQYFVQPALGVQAGDVLGIYQPSDRMSRYSIIYQETGGPINYRRGGRIDTFNLNEGNVKTDQEDYPLVGVRISNTACASGFLSRNVLIVKGRRYAGEGTNTVAFDREQRLIPGISFGCDGWLNKWIVAATEKSGGRRNSYPQLQIWRPSSFNPQSFNATPIRLTTLQQPEASQRIGLNLYEYVLQTPFQFRAGDIFGLHQPEKEQSELLLHYLEVAGPVNFRLANQDLPSSFFSTELTNVAVEQSNLPLVTVEITVDCGRLQHPQNGDISYSSSTASGSTATYNCRQGYTLDGMKERTCQVTNAQWSGSASACRQVTSCTHPPNLEHGTIVLTATTPGTESLTAEYSCSDGYRLVGIRIRTCQQNGTWSGEPPSCQLIECETLTQPDGGTVAITSTPGGIGKGSVANYDCNRGFYLDGESMRTCQEDGQWTGVAPICRKTECDGLADPDDGTVTITPDPDEIGVGSEATYGCNYGFELQGNTTRTCQEDGQWTNMAPVCIETECDDLADPVDGTVTITPNHNEIGVGSEATYGCNDWFELQGNTTRTCQEDGQWTNMAPICIVIECEGLTDPDHGSVTITPSQNESHVESIATYNCNRGYKLDGYSMITCQENGEWNNMVPVCNMIECEGLADPDNGIVTITPSPNKIGVGSEANYRCNRGFNLEGESMLICNESGLWTNTTPMCRLIECQGLTNPDDGIVTITPNSNEIGVDSVANYSCSPEFGLFGQPIRTCQENGQWTNTAPVCIRSCNLDLLSHPENGRVRLTAKGRMAVYSCDIGYKIAGNSTQVCQLDGQWSGEEPTCEAVNCGIPPEVEKGVSSTNGSTLYSVTSYSCSTGYKLNGSNHVVCQQNESWTGQLPTCEVVDCSLPPEVANGLSSTNGSTLYSVATYNCSVGYQLSGKNSYLVCQENELWSGQLPICESTISKNTPPPKTPVTLSTLLVSIIIAVLVIVIISMCGIMILLYVKRRKSRTAVNNHQHTHNSVENPLYTGVEAGNESLPKEREAAAIELQPICNGDRKSGGAHYYDLADFFQHNPTGSSSGSRTPRYEVATASGAFHSYEFADDTLHYEMASNASLYEIPASPYEIPTPQGNLHNIYGTIQWGTYVPTKEQRGLSGKSIILQSPITPADQRTFFEESDIYWKPASDSASLYAQLAKNKYREILRHQIQITEHLGSGQFGTVHKGLWQSPGGTVEVAVKTLNAGATENDKVKFLQESAINGQFLHPNVVQLHGVVTVGEPVMIVLELLNGDLRNYLIRQRPAPGEMMSSEWPGLLVKFCQQIASGMECLSKKAFVHRDLAARNILVANDKTCKISDFGMSRDLEDENYYISNGGKIPVKWTAPEALHFKKYSTASDVWSYGIVMFEIWGLGRKPFEELSNPEAIKVTDMGFRLTPPPGCPRAVYQLMIQCWHPETASRPNFTAILQALFYSDDPADLLCWTEEDMMVHPQAAVLGAPLEAGKDLYPELQMAYSSNQ